MKKGYQSVQMRVWRYSEDIVRTSGESMGAGTPTCLIEGNDFSNPVITDVMDN